MSEPIEVPESAFENKPWFNSYPSPELIREIKDHVRATGEPHTWRGHSHTQPPKGGKVVYVDEFDVPTFGYSMDRVAPCPCCSLRSRKYKIGGKIAWFPDEGVIRLIGPQCYRSLDAEGHDLAERDLRVRLNREKQARYLIQQLPTLPAIIAAGEEVVVMATAMDAFRENLQRCVGVTLNMRLWGHIRDGVLNTVASSMQVVAGRDGQHRQQMVSTQKRHGSIAGWQVMDPKATRVAPGLRTQIEKLRELHKDLSARDDIRNTDDLGLRRAAKTMAQGQKTIVTAIERIRVERQFAHQITVATLNTWGQLDDPVLRASFRRRGRDLMIGFDPQHAVRVPIPEEMERALPVLPHLAEE